MRDFEIWRERTLVLESQIHELGGDKVDLRGRLERARERVWEAWCRRVAWRRGSQASERSV